MSKSEAAKQHCETGVNWLHFSTTLPFSRSNIQIKTAKPFSSCLFSNAGLWNRVPYFSVFSCMLYWPLILKRECSSTIFNRSLEQDWLINSSVTAFQSQIMVSWDSNIFLQHPDKVSPESTCHWVPLSVLSFLQGTCFTLVKCARNENYVDQLWSRWLNRINSTAI